MFNRDLNTPVHSVLSANYLFRIKNADTTAAVALRCSVQKVILKALEISQENTWVGESF